MAKEIDMVEDIDILDENINEFEKEVKKENIENIKKKKEKKIVVEQIDVLRIKWNGILTTIFLKLLIRFIIIIFFFIFLKIPILKDFILSYYYLHYLFLFVFFILMIDLFFFVVNFIGDMQDILYKNIFIETIVKQKEVNI